jgi:predicted TIM-barrel fold metal-dependent hydrolase
MGTDYPFGERKPVEFVRRAKRLSKAVQDGILGRNAARFFGIKA